MKQLYRIVFLAFIINSISAKTHSGHLNTTISTEVPNVDNNFLPPGASISGTATVCRNATNPLITFTGTGGTAPYTFSYSINGVSQTPVSTTVASNIVQIAAATNLQGTFNYTITSVTDATGSAQSVSGNATITVLPIPDAMLNGTGSGTFIDNIPVFRVCSNTITQFDFINSSATIPFNVNYTINWGDGSPDFTATSWANVSHTYQVGIWNLTYTVVHQNGCIDVEPYIVFIGSNPGISLGNPGNTDICSTETLVFPITGTSTNPPGTTYTVSFNDGSPDQIYTHPPPASVSHTFAISSCGFTSSNGITSYPNSFSANVVASNPCGESAVGVVPIRVSTPPVADFMMPPITCTNSVTCITNTSLGNENVGATCSNPKIIWTISPAVGFTLSSGTLGNDFGSANPALWTSGSNIICPIFTQTGTYTITLKTGNRCDTDTIVQTICVEAPPAPLFTTNTNAGCTPLAVNTTNTTLPVTSCTPANYLWDVTYAAANCGSGPATWTFANGTGPTDANPSFNFVTPGTYTITLSMTNSCGTFSTTQVVNVKQLPNVVINPIADFCGSASFIPAATVNACTTLPGVTYAWSFPGGNPATASTSSPGTITYATAGNYSISLTVTNECGSSATATENFTVNDVPAITNTNLTQVICSGSPSLPINITADIGSTTFTWTAVGTAGVTGFTSSGSGNTIPAQTISTSGSVPGTVTYSVTPTANGCPGPIVQFIITINTAPNFSSQPLSETLCQNGVANALSANYANGSGTPSYQWYSNTVNSNVGGTSIPGESNATFIPPSSAIGTVYYYVVITLSAGGCPNLISNPAAITVVPGLSIATQPTALQDICVGGSLPVALTATYNGGTGNATYQWFSNTVASNSSGTLIAGATSQTYMPPAFGSVGTYYYYLQTTLSGNGCGSIVSNVAQINVFADPTLTTQPLTTQTVCQNTVAVPLTVVASGGIGTFSYQWFSNTVNNTTSGTAIVGAVTDTFGPPTSAIGTVYYYVVVSQTGVDCQVISATAAVIVNQAPVITAEPISESLCVGSTASTLTVNYNGGVGNPMYQWYSNSVNTTTGATAIPGAIGSTYSPSSASVGTIYYFVTIDFTLGGCSSLTSVIAQVSISPIPVVGAESALLCSGQTFTITPVNSGGNTIPSGTTYTWTAPLINPVGAVTGASAQPIPQLSISQTLTNSTNNPATVTYTVTPSSSSCSGNSFTIIVTVNPAIMSNTVITDVSCNGNNDGSIQITISGGIPFTPGTPYLISWTGPNAFTSSASSISSLEPGVYDLDITDSSGCTFAASYIIAEPAPLIIATDLVQNITCFGSGNGLINVTTSGGTAPYTFAWTKNTAAFASTEDIASLGPGIYELTLTDANGCIEIQSHTITEPQVLLAVLDNQTNILCFGAATGAISVTISGGTQTSGYSFSWTGPNGFTSMSEDLNALFAGNYLLTVTDDSGCTDVLNVTLTQSTDIIITPTVSPIICFGDNNASISVSISGGNAPYNVQWSNFAVGLTQTNLGPGTYTITVTDAVNCVKILPIIITQPPLFTITPVVQQISCFGEDDGSINLNITGGVAPINLVWSDGSTAGGIRNNLSAGTYTATVTDSGLCTLSATFVIVEPQAIVLSANITHATDCDDANSGAINLLVSGGTPPFTYAWSNGVTTEDLTAIPSGNHAVTVTDANGCVKTGQYVVTRQDPILITVDDDTDFDCTTREVEQFYVATVSGGIPPYQLNWSSGTVSGANNQIMSPSSEGTVILDVIDGMGCTASYTFETDIPVLGFPSFDVDSYGFSTYGFYAIVDPIQFTNTATGDYVSVAWDFGDGSVSDQENPAHSYQTVGTYVVTQTVTYPFGCVYVQTITLVVEKGYDIITPNAFTPNADGINDFFAPLFRGLKTVRLSVYDTWGGLIYFEEGLTLRGWDGLVNGVESENGNFLYRVTSETFYGVPVELQEPFLLIR